MHSNPLKLRRIQIITLGTQSEEGGLRCAERYHFLQTLLSCYYTSQM